jgi:hypothetical protein
MARPATQGRLVTLGCRALRTVAAVARTVTARVLLVVMVPWASTTGAVSSPLVRSYGGVGAVDVQERGVEEPSEEEPCVDGGKNCICKWFGHLTEFISALLASVSSLRPLLKG